MELDELPREECLRLLAAGGVGRVSIPTEAAPAIRPVNFTLDAGRVIFQTGDGLLWAAGRRGLPAGFEIDAASTADHTGWSVVVTGHLTAVTAAERDDVLALHPWAPGAKTRLVALSIEQLSGRRLVRPGSTPQAVRPTENSDPDNWGRSEAARRTARRLIEPIYRWWFRFSWTGLAEIPPDGALLVANHAGAVPVDAMLLMHGIEKELGRRVYGLHHHGLRQIPFAGTALARQGGVVAHPDNALRLLRDEQQLVLVFPEGTKGTTKRFDQRYRLARFGRGGFIETAMRAGVPVVPIAVTGTEEAMPSFVRLPTASETGIPIPLNVMLLGPVGAFVPFPVTISAQVLPPVVFDQPPDLAHYPSSEVAAATERVRASLQAALDRRIGRSRARQ